VSVTAQATDAKIRVEHLAKCYGDRTVFRDVSFDVADGEIVSIVGPSGCGKTTLLRCVVGLMPPTEGSVSITGKRVDSPPEGVAMVFQHFGLFPWKTVAANIAYGLTVRGVRRRAWEPQIRDLVKLVGLEGFEKAYPYQLSGGMQQRAGLARALAIEPTVLVMDEPFASLDAQTRDVLQLELLRIWETRRTATMFVTHSIDEAVLMGDRIVILQGRPSRIFDIVEVGIPRPRDRSAVDSERFRVVRDYVWKAVMKQNLDPSADPAVNVGAAPLAVRNDSRMDSS
jgi:NitT/TauT family transport system ATP-binding protein